MNTPATCHLPENGGPRTDSAAPVSIQIEAIFERLAYLGEDDFRKTIWKTFGGLQHYLETAPATRLTKFVELLDNNISECEARRPRPAA